MRRSLDDEFLVYGWSSPMFDLTWGVDRTWETEPAAVPGKCFVLSGGYTRESPRDRSPDIFMNGCLEMASRTGSRVAETLLRAISQHTQTAMLLLYVSRDEMRPCVNLLLDAGFLVEETDDLLQGRDSAYALAKGAPKCLPPEGWLESVRGYDPFGFHACQEEACPLVHQTYEALRQRQVPDKAEAAILQQVEANPASAIQLLGKGYIHVTTDDPDARSMKILSPDPDVRDWEQVLVSIAGAHKVPLFNSGQLRINRAEGDERLALDDYELYWDRWIPLPPEWQRVV